jgi:tetratricopeptide (TPR) repeat protein
MGSTISMIKILLIPFMLVFTIYVQAQDLVLTNEAARLCQEKKYDDARSKINEAMQSEMELNHPFTWYVQGFIYKEIYKEKESLQRDSEARTKAVESLCKSIELDHKKEYSKMSRAALQYLCNTYYNDAMLRSREFDMTNDTSPAIYFMQFKLLMHIVDPAKNLSIYDKDYHKAMAQRYYTLWIKDTDNTVPVNKAIENYDEAISIDSTDCDINFNLAIIYYNQAVFMIRKIGPDTDIIEMLILQEKAVSLYKKTIPFLHASERNCPPKKEVLKGLMFVYGRLEREAQELEYKDKYERLLNSEKK